MIPKARTRFAGLFFFLTNIPFLQKTFTEKSLHKLFSYVHLLNFEFAKFKFQVKLEFTKLEFDIMLETFLVM